MTALRPRGYFDRRATLEMVDNLPLQERDVRERLAYAARILAMTGQEAGLAGQISARSSKANC
jgi:L-fuculose-phosphate aldolase